VRILIVGTGVISSVYAGRLASGGQQVTLLARGQRLADLRERGLVLHDAATGGTETFRLPVTDSPAAAGRFDLALVPVRREQLDSIIGLLQAADTDTVVLFGNTAGRVARLTTALGSRSLFGFPAAGGVRDGAVIRYVTIRQQRTMLAEPSGTASARVRQLAEMFGQAGFRTHVSSDPQGWLFAHAAFIVPIALALYRVGVEPSRLAADKATLQLMVQATRQAFRALQHDGNREIPANLRMLYLTAPSPVAMRYWKKVMAGPNGELWFAAHTRAAPDEMRSLAEALNSQINVAAERAPALAELIAAHPRRP
jgi:2-dehydropantoate 2-reductase